MASMAPSPLRILGIDPGYGTIGYGVVKVVPHSGVPKILDYGTIQLSPTLSLVDRLPEIATDLQAILDKYHPQVMGIEQLFFFKNITTALDVASARGVILYIAKKAGLRVCEYAPLQVKKAMTSNGRATKATMQKAVRRVYGIPDDQPLNNDAADALAIALMASMEGKK
jgi:crossover junction endodeoxyribonuclease RuvC